MFHQDNYDYNGSDSREPPGLKHNQKVKAVKFADIFIQAQKEAWFQKEEIREQSTSIKFFTCSKCTQIERVNS